MRLRGTVRLVCFVIGLTLSIVPTGAQDAAVIHLVQHSHVDAGWNYTYLQYYLTLRLILERVTIALLRSPDRRFTYGEPVAFLARYVQEEGSSGLRVKHFQSSWNDYDLRGGVQVPPSLIEHLHLAAIPSPPAKAWDWHSVLERDNLTRKDALDYLIRRGQFEIVGGGWVSHDELLTTIDAQRRNLRIGLAWLRDNFQIRPHIAWQPDQFGHSALTPMVFGDFGYKLMILGRLPYKTHQSMASRGDLLFNWQEAESDQSILSFVFHKHYNYPSTAFDFDRPSTTCDVPRLYKELVATARQARPEYPETGHVLIPIGDDLRFMEAERWFACLTRVIKLSQNASAETGYIVQFSTVTEFAESALSAPQNYVSIAAEFAPYEDRPFENYWTGQYTTRPTLKKLIYEAERSVRSAEFVIARSMAQAYMHFSTAGHDAMNKVRIFRNSWAAITNRLDKARSDLAILSHHDAITGTCVQSAADDYSATARSITASVHGLVAESLGVLRANASSAEGAEGLVVIRHACQNVAASCQIRLHVIEPLRSQLGNRIIKIYLTSSALKWAGKEIENLAIIADLEGVKTQVIPVSGQDLPYALDDLIPNDVEADTTRSFLILAWLPVETPPEIMLVLTLARHAAPERPCFLQSDLSTEVQLGPPNSISYKISADSSKADFRVTRLGLSQDSQSWTISLAQYHPTKFEPSGAYIFRSWVVSYFPVWFLGGVGLWSSYVASLTVQILLERRPAAKSSAYPHWKPSFPIRLIFAAVGIGFGSSQMLLHVLLQVFHAQRLAEIAGSVMQTISLIIFPSCFLGAGLAWSLLYFGRRHLRNPVMFSLVLTVGLVLGTISKLSQHPRSQARTIARSSSSQLVQVSGEICDFLISRIDGDTVQSFRSCLGEDFLAVTTRAKLQPNREMVIRYDSGSSFFSLPGCDFGTFRDHRLRRHRYNWRATVPGNYKPVIQSIASSVLQVNVKQPLGGTCMSDGLLELMLHRRLSGDDQKGLRERNDDQSVIKAEQMVFPASGGLERYATQIPMITDLSSMPFAPQLSMLRDAQSAYELENTQITYTTKGLVYFFDLFAHSNVTVTAERLGLPDGALSRVQSGNVAYRLLTPAENTLSAGESGTFRLLLP